MASAVESSAATVSETSEIKTSVHAAPKVASVKTLAFTNIEAAKDTVRETITKQVADFNEKLDDSNTIYADTINTISSLMTAMQTLVDSIDTMCKELEHTTH